MIGPGKYDSLAAFVKDYTQAEGVIIVVFNGNQGHGMSCKLTERLMMPAAVALNAAIVGIYEDYESIQAQANTETKEENGNQGPEQGQAGHINLE